MEDASKQYGQQNFSLPHDVITLPSGGRFYKSKKKSIKVGYLTAADENLLMSNQDDIITALVRSKLYEPDLKPSELLQGDLEAILIFLRNTAFSPDYNVSVNDPVSGERFSTTISLEELNIKQPEVEPDSFGNYEVTLPKSGVTVKLRLLTLGDIKEIEEMIKKYPQGMVAPKITWTLQKQIVSVNGDEEKGVVNKFIEQMPIFDSKFIKKFLDTNEPRLDLVKRVNSPSGVQVDVVISFGAEFFRVFF
jgi:hypothetical protein